MYRTLESPITFRRQEYLVRDDTIQKVAKSVQMVNTFVEGIRLAPESEQYHTEAEIEKALSVAKAAEEWNEDKLKQQLALSPVDDPVLTSKDAAAKAKDVDEALMQLLRKKKPKAAPKKKEAPKNDSSTATPDDDQSTTSDNNTEKESNNSSEREHAHDEL